MMPSPENAPTDIIAGLSALAGRYDILLCDVWGVLHNGITAFPEAGDALARFRAEGGTVVLLTNAPRPNTAVRDMLDSLHARRDAYDAIVSSGDITRGEIAARAGQKLYHLGPKRDLPVFEGLDVTFANADEADFVVCTGLFDDDSETPADYADSLAAMAVRGLTMICANPDLVVERGEHLIFCAGALAAAYEQHGGQVIYAGKPHAPVYAHAVHVAAKLRADTASAPRVLAIGDAMRTDIAGAVLAGYDSLFVARGIHAAEVLDSHGRLAQPQLAQWLAKQDYTPRMAIERLVW